MISFSSDIESLDLFRSEICRIPLKPNPLGYIQTMSKPELLVLKTEAPNMADSVMMSGAIKPPDIINQVKRQIGVAAAAGWT